jgi:hypothetical protein
MFDKLQKSSNCQTANFLSLGIDLLFDCFGSDKRLIWSSRSQQAIDGLGRKVLFQSLDQMWLSKPRTALVLVEPNLTQQVIHWSLLDFDLEIILRNQLDLCRFQ